MSHNFFHAAKINLSFFGTICKSTKKFSQEAINFMTGFDYSNALKFVRPHEVDSMKAITLAAADLLKSRKGAGNDFLG